jgi:enamine deaminase RidA (YjgF/YER057c/UK114 family)
MSLERTLAPGGAYSESIRVQGLGIWVYISGILGLDSDSEGEQRGTYREATAAFESMRRIVEQAGGRLSDVVRITTYLTRLDDYPEFARARTQAFGDSPPASAAVEVSRLLQDASVEIEAVAFIST